MRRRESSAAAAAPRDSVAVAGGRAADGARGVEGAEAEVKECGKCKGKGYVTATNPDYVVGSLSLHLKRKTCSWCDGKGFVREYPVEGEGDTK